MHSQEEGLGNNRRAAAQAVSLAGCVLLSGAAVMIYEFLAVRILSRYFGSSIDVWASVIAVLLAGLTAGYAIGGVLADRFGSVQPLALALVVAGGTGVFAERIATAVSTRLLGIDWALAWHPYVAAVFVSFIPVFALGTVLPQAIRLRAERTRRLGSAAGWIAAISTLGSILGVLLTVHLLLPRTGIRETLYGISGLLVLAGMILPALSLRRAVPVLLFFCLIQPTAHAQTIYENYSAYHHILVEDAHGTRTLWFDSAPQSTMSLDDAYAGGFEYTDFFHAPLLLDPTIASVLFVGLGGGTGPKAFLRDYPQIRVEVAEIDPVVLDVARAYFALPDEPRLRVVIRDGRVHLQRSQTKFGAVIMDAYASGPYGAYVPYHLTTQEFFKIAWNKLENAGCLVYNVIGVYGRRQDETVRGIYATLGTVFQAVYAFQARSSMNTVLVAQKIDARKLFFDGTRDRYAWPQGPWLRHPLNATELRDLARTLMHQGMLRVPGFDKRVTQFSGLQNAPPDGPIYTDNYAPVDLAPGRRRGVP